MRFAYKQLGKSFLRPVIPIEILSGDESVRYEVLVDSGADCNLVPAEIGELLGLDVEKGRKTEVGGITGGGMPFYVHEVTIRVGKESFSVPMGFMPAIPPFGYDVVGQQGFFDRFRVTFDYQDAEIDLTPY